MKDIMKLVTNFGWVAILPVVFLVYTNSFNTLPIIEKRHCFLADGVAFLAGLRRVVCSVSKGARGMWETS